MFFFSEVHHTMSAPLEDVAKSIANNGICLKVYRRQKLHFCLLDTYEGMLISP